MANKVKKTKKVTFDKALGNIGLEEITDTRIKHIYVSMNEVFMDEDMEIILPSSIFKNTLALIVLITSSFYFGYYLSIIFD